ncbi:J domain-containing protein [Microbacterium sp. bgisy203]|uniref:J domain-containing protein n=1 Tax=Microbacterium sp. bgisy203 TaxID=3413799 RepID=UPI003D71DDA0
MTLDEAREALGVSRGASVSEIRDAFRRRAREVHPDRHPSEDDATRRRLGREFDRAREARDILVKFTNDSARIAAPAPAGAGTSRTDERPRPSTAPPASTPSSPTNSPPPRRERARPRTSESRPQPEAPRVTVRFDDFVRAADAAGFGPGIRTRRWIDWPRIIAWSTVGTLVALVVGGGYVAAYLM